MSVDNTDVHSRYDLAGRRTLARFSATVTPSADCSAINSGIDCCYDAAGCLGSTAIVTALRLAAAIIGFSLHRSTIVNIRGESYRLREKRQAELADVGPKAGQPQMPAA